MDDRNFDVIIVGGSYAGLAAAMTLGRSLRKTLVVDGGKTCNRFTPHSHNFLTQDGNTPAAISALAREQVAEYDSVKFLTDLVTDVEQQGDLFLVKTESGKIFQAEKLVFATGIKDLLPDIPGFAECWGKTIIHCPYCHGYEFRGKKTGILAGSEDALHLVPLVHNLTTELTLLTNGRVKISAEEKARLDKNNVAIISSEIAEVLHHQGELKQLVFSNGEKIDFDALYAGLPFEQHCAIPVKLGCALTEKGYFQTDMFYETTVKGVYACGDNVSPFRSVANAVAGGNMTGAVINRELAVKRF